jgi:hypothetical protein
MSEWSVSSSELAEFLRARTLAWTLRFLLWGELEALLLLRKSKAGRKNLLALRVKGRDAFMVLLREAGTASIAS